MRQELDAICRLSKGSGKMKAVAMILVILLTMPVSYAMLDEAMKKIRIRNKMKPQ
jgi:multisubunit Na+/H+ antiporter MnhG subunit